MNSASSLARVGPRLGQRFERGPGLLHVMHDVQQIARRARQAVNPRDQQHVALVESGEGLLELRPVGGRAADVLAEHFDRTGG
jgi:hypothetical protein